MLIQLSYGLGSGKDSDGDGLKYIGELITARHSSALIMITTVPHDLDPPIGIASKPFIFIGHSSGAGAMEKWARAAGVPVNLMILSDTFPLLTDGQLIAASYNQPAFVEELLAFRQTEGILQGKPVIAGQNFKEIVLPAIPGQTGLAPHLGLLKRQEVIDKVIAAVDRVAKQNKVPDAPSG